MEGIKEPAFVTFVWRKTVRQNLYAVAIRKIRFSNCSLFNQCYPPQVLLIAFAAPDFFKVYLSDTGLLCSKLGLYQLHLFFSPTKT